MLKFLVTFLVKFDICIVVVCCSESWKLKWSSAGDLLLMAKDFEIWNDWKIIGWWFEIIRLYIDDIYDKWIWIIKSMFRFQCFSVVMIRIHFPIFQGLKPPTRYWKCMQIWLGEDEKGSLWRLGWVDLLFYISFWVWVSCCAKTGAQGYGSISAILRNDVVRQRAVIVGSDAGRHKPCEGCCNFPYSDPGVDVLWYYEILYMKYFRIFFSTFQHLHFYDCSPLHPLILHPLTLGM